MNIGDERSHQDDEAGAAQELRTRMGLGVLGSGRRARAGTMLMEVTLPDEAMAPVAGGTSSVEPPPSGRLPVGAQVGRWRITEVMAEGGTCEIYGVEHVRKGTRGALRLAKLRALDEAPSLPVRMHDNARELLYHTIEHLYQIYSYGWVNGPRRRPYVITERLVGDNLEAHLRRHGLMEWRQAALVVEQAARAMVGFHALGRVHCDLSPGNLVIQELGDTLYVTVIDVDFARSMSEPKSPGHSPGTPGFIPPEHALEVRPTVAFDIFALGSVLIYAITGRPAIDPAEYCRIIALGNCSVQQRGWATLRQRREVPPALVDLARRLTHPDRAMRPASAAEVAERLRAIRLGEVEAKPNAEEADRAVKREERREERRRRPNKARRGVGDEPSEGAPTMEQASHASRSSWAATRRGRWSAGERLLVVVAVILLTSVVGWIAAA